MLGRPLPSSPPQLLLLLLLPGVGEEVLLRELKVGSVRLPPHLVVVEVKSPLAVTLLQVVGRVLGNRGHSLARMLAAACPPVGLRGETGVRRHGWWKS